MKENIITSLTISICFTTLSYLAFHDVQVSLLIMLAAFVFNSSMNEIIKILKEIRDKK